MQVRKKALGHLVFLGRGAFGEVFNATGFHLPDDSAPLAYKEFTSDRIKQARSARAAVEFRETLSPFDRADLDQCYAWPRALVEDESDAVCGLLIPLNPPEFFCRQLDPESGQMTSKLRTMAWLMSSRKQREAARVDIRSIDKTERLILLAKLAWAISLLHKHDWVFGDLNFTNMAFALDPPRLMLIDCDNTAALADVGRSQPSTPFWDPPECPTSPRLTEWRQQELQDTVTDVYKLGLAILRCLTPGKGAATSSNVNRLAGELDGEGIGLLARALSADGASRPTANELYTYLAGVISRRIGVHEVAIQHKSVLHREEEDTEFDVFLCHNVADKPNVRWTAERLRERGILPWLDETELPPGRPWQEELERQIDSIRSAAVFVGPNGFGPWQNQEVMAFLREFVERQCPVIPVLLPGAVTPTLPLFLRGMTWVDLRTMDPAAIERLIWGITGRKPERSG